VLILLADDDEAFLLWQGRALISELEDFSTVLVVERGNALRTDSGEADACSAIDVGRSGERGKRGKALGDFCRQMKRLRA